MENKDKEFTYCSFFQLNLHNVAGELMLLIYNKIS